MENWVKNKIQNTKRNKIQNTKRNKKQKKNKKRATFFYVTSLFQYKN